MSATTARPAAAFGTFLDRAAAGAPAAPERIVHLGLGAFHRAHQAWYTAHASDAGRWGIVAFTGRSRDLVDRMAPQQGLFTLVERGAEGDRYELVPSIVRVEAGDDVALFVRAVASPDVAILTLTITEAGYLVDASGSLAPDDPAVKADIGLLRAAVADSGGTDGETYPRTALGRIALALHARRLAGGGPLALVSCDNLPDNGGLLRRALQDLVARVSPALLAWITESVSFVSTSVDRITPAIDTAAESATVAEATGWLDAAPVVAEPFADWVLSGDFPAGRPDWESAGARFVDDLAPWESRKLWMLNGAHTVLAALGQARGHTVVSAAIDDHVCRRVVRALWDDVAGQLPMRDLAGYRVALVQRFRNRRIEHGLAQIALDSTTKMRLRIVPVALGELAGGRSADGCAAAIAAWMVGVGAGTVPSPGGVEVPGSGILDSQTQSDLLDALDPRLLAHDAFLARIAEAFDWLAASAVSPSSSTEGDEHP